MKKREFENHGRNLFQFLVFLDYQDCDAKMNIHEFTFNTVLLKQRSLAWIVAEKIQLVVVEDYESENLKKIIDDNSFGNLGLSRNVSNEMTQQVEHQCFACC